MSRHKKKDFEIESVEIEGIAAEGNAVAHIDGKALFVPQCVPGDIVNVNVTKDKKNYMQGFVTAIVKESPNRQKPFCRHFGTCGGCSWQLLPYQMQLDAKRQQVVDQFVRIGHLDMPESGVNPTLGSENITEYRNKLEYTFSNRRWILSGEDPDALTERQRLGLGFHVSGFFDKVLDIEKCWLQREPTNEIRLFVKQYAIDNGLSFYDLRAQVGFLRNLMVRTTSTGETMLLVVFGPEAIIDVANGQTATKTVNLWPNSVQTEQTSTKTANLWPNGAQTEQTATKQGTFVAKSNENDKTATNNGQNVAIDQRGIALLGAIHQRFPEINSLQYALNPKCNDALGDLPVYVYYGEDAVYEQMENLKFKIGPKSFYQTNSKQAYKLYSVVRNFINKYNITANNAADCIDTSTANTSCASCITYTSGSSTTGEAPTLPVIYDLYTGTGTIALFHSAMASKVIGIEYVPEAIDDAWVNARENGITNCTFFAGDMKDMLVPSFIQEHGKPDIVILDPPRAGIHPDVAQVLLDTAAPFMVYVSCNPASQARDLQTLCQKYEILEIQPVDMFPHTIHVENVVALKLKTI